MLSEKENSVYRPPSILHLDFVRLYILRAVSKNRNSTQPFYFTMKNLSESFLYGVNDVPPQKKY